MPKKIRTDILSDCCNASIEEYPRHDNNGEEIPAHNMFCSECGRGVYFWHEVILDKPKTL